MLPTDCLQLLTIDLERADPPVRKAFAFGADEQRALLLGAGRHGVPLVLLATSRSFHLLSTSQNHVRAFRPALAEVQKRAEGVPGALALKVRVTQGSDAARQLLRQATPFARLTAEAEQFLGELRAAAALSSTCGTFSGELAALFQLTGHAAERIRSETRLGRSGTLEAELELEALVAERILEEELLAWQSSYPALRASVRPPLSERALDLFASDEPLSVVRLRAARVLTKLRAS